MEVTNKSDLILILNLEDYAGEPMRVADTAYFKVRVWTNDPTHYLTFGKRDIIQDADNDRIAIDTKQLECLNSGVIKYDYDYSKWNADFSATDEEYNKVKTVITDIYFRNAGIDTDNPCNVVNFQTIEHLRDLIEKEGMLREQQYAQLAHYVKVDYTNKLDNEIKRSNQVDIEFYNKFKNLEKSFDDYNGDLTDKIDAEYLRAKTAETALDNRLDSAELVIEQIHGDETQIGSVAHAVKESKDYTDDSITKVTKGYAKKSELDAVEAKIPVVNHNLSAYHNDCGYISNTDIFDNYYNKAQIDNKIDNIEDNIDFTPYATKDSVTVVKDEDGNIIHEMVIDPNPDYYTKAECDELFANVNEKVDNLDSSLTDYVNDVKDELKNDVSVLDASVTATVDTVKSNLENQISNLDASVTGNIDTLKNDVSANVADLNNKITALDASVTATVDTVKSNLENQISNLDASVAENVNALKTNLESQISALDASITNVKNELKNDVSTLNKSLTDYVDATRLNLETEISNLDSSVANTLNDYYTKSQVDTVKNELKSDISNLDSSVTANIASVKTEIEDKIDEKIGDIDFSDFETIVRAEEKYQPKGDYLTEHQSLADYYTKTEVDAIDSSISAKIDEKIGDIDFSDYYTKSQVDNLIPKQKIWFGKESQAPALEDRNEQTLYIIV